MRIFDFIDGELPVYDFTSHYLGPLNLRSVCKAAAAQITTPGNLE